MNKRKVTKVFNKAELERFTELPIERMDLLSESIVDNAEGNVKLAEAVDTCLSMMLSKAALKKVTSRKMYVRWKGWEKLYPILDRVEVFRYGKRKYLMVAHIVDGAKPA
jgi:hypothetical protein